ncbi:MAG: hypothetical protein ABL921_28980, partial [Pirellula sp.]
FDTISHAVGQEWILKIHEPLSDISSQIVLPATDVINDRLRELEHKIEEIAKNQGIDSTAEKARQQDDAKQRAFNRLLLEVMARSNLDTNKLGFEQHLVQLNFRKFIDCLLSVCDAVVHAHRLDLLHLGLSACKGIEFGLDDERVYCTGWYWSHVKEAPWSPECHITTCDVAPWQIDIQELGSGCEPTIRTDVALVGDILAFVLYDHQHDSPSNHQKLRKVFYSHTSHSEQQEIHQAMLRLEKVSKKALVGPVASWARIAVSK